MSKIVVPNGVIFLEDDVRSLGDIRNRIQICDKSIHDSSEKLKMLAIANPKDIVPKGEDTLVTISERVNEIVEEIEYECEHRALLNNAQDYVEAWHYAYEDEHEKIDTSTQEGFDRVVVSGEKSYRSPKFDMTRFSIRDYKSLDEYVNDCVTDLKNDSFEVENEKWVILFDGKLLSNENMEFTFQSYEKAESKVFDMLSLSIHDIFNKRYIESNKDFIDDIRNACNEDDRNTIDDYINELGDKPFVFEKLELVYRIFKKIILEKLKDRIVIKKIN